MISFPLINLNYWSQRLEIFCKAFWPTMPTSIRFDQNMGNISWKFLDRFFFISECVSYQSFKILEILGSTLEDVKLNFNSYFDYFSNFQCAMMKKKLQHIKSTKEKWEGALGWNSKALLAQERFVCFQILIHVRDSGASILWLRKESFSAATLLFIKTFKLALTRKSLSLKVANCAGFEFESEKIYLIFDKIFWDQVWST